MLKFIIVIFTIFANTANSFASDNIYLIEDNEIYLENNGNVLELRENAKEISFQNAFNRLNLFCETNREEMDKSYRCFHFSSNLATHC